MAQLIDATKKWEKAKLDNSKVKDILPLIMKKNPEARKNLAKVFLEDEAIKKASRENSLEYLKRCDEEYNRTPYWEYALMWFAIGMLFVITVENIFISDNGLIIHAIANFFGFNIN